MDEPQNDAGELVREATRGEPVAIEALVERMLPALHAFVRLRRGGTLRRHEETVDLVQSACREVLDDLAGHEWVSEARFRHWLFTCAESKIRDRLRYWKAVKRDAAREAAPRGPRGLSWPALIAAHGPSPSRAAAAREDVEALARAFDVLSDDERGIVLLARLVGLSSAEIGAELGRPEATIRKTLSRATARLVMTLRSTDSLGKDPES